MLWGRGWNFYPFQKSTFFLISWTTQRSLKYLTKQNLKHTVNSFESVLMLANLHISIAFFSSNDWLGIWVFREGVFRTLKDICDVARRENNFLSKKLYHRCLTQSQIHLCCQPAITCLKLTIETLEQDVKYVQS